MFEVVAAEKVYSYALMHGEFVVVDGETVETGNFNFTSSAEFRNGENVLVLDDPVVAQKYVHKWQRLWDESVEVKGRY